VTVGGLAGLVEIVYAHNGQTDLPDLADELSFELDDLLPIVDAATMLGLLEVEGAQAFLTGAGQLDIAIDWGRYGELFDYDAFSSCASQRRQADAPSAAAAWTQSPPATIGAIGRPWEFTRGWRAWRGSSRALPR
jgi:hypothetical protein